MAAFDPTICLCTGVSEDTIIGAVLGGAHDLAAIRDACGANSQCGDCAGDIEEILAETLSS